MTVIAGVVHRGTVVMGADSAGSANWSMTIRKDPKLFHTGQYLIGFTYSFRMGQVLRHVFKPPAPPKRANQVERFMVVDFVDALRAALKASGWSKLKDGQEEGGTFLVGTRGRLFRVEPDYQVGETRDGYDAVGCGGEIACGALHATAGMKPEARVRLALRAAERHSAGVRGPFAVLTLEAR